MRMRGQSYTEISEGLGMSKSTLSEWFRHLEVSKETQDKISARSKAASINALLKVNRERTLHAEERIRTSRSSSLKDIGKLSSRDLLIMGTLLYWTEGHKRPIMFHEKARTYHPVSFTSSDPEKVKLFLRFIREYCKVEEEKITADIRIFNQAEKARILDFWSKATGLMYSNFRKIYKSKVNIPYGIIQIRINDTALYHKIMGWIEGLKKL